MSDFLNIGTNLASIEEDPIEKISILEIYKYLTGYSSITHKVSGQYLVRCAVENHKDESPSCSLNSKTDSWRCFACGNKGGKLKLIIAAGKAKNKYEAAEWIKEYIGVENLIFKPQPAIKAKQVRGNKVELVDKKEIAIHKYKDDSGRTIYEVLRYQGKPTPDGLRTKTFSQRLIGPDGKWIWTFKGQNFKKYPYLVEKIIQAGKEKKVLLMLEGEIHCDALDAIGIYTTTVAEGWQHEWEKWWNKFLIGIPMIFILSDADEVGRKAADKRAKSMTSNERKVAVIDIFPNRNNGDDILNWMIEEKILKDYHDVTKIATPINWKKMYLMDLEEARKKVVDKITNEYKKSKKTSDSESTT